MREIRWTDETEEHIARHDVAPGEVEHVVNTRPRLTGPGRDGKELIYGTVVGSPAEHDDPSARTGGHRHE